MNGGERIDVVLYADHNQFSVGDGAWSEVDEEAAEELWSHAALEDHLGVQRGTLVVYTATYGYVRVVVERADEPADADGFDHVVEAPLVVGSGGVTALETTEPKGALAVPSGSYRARVSWRGVAEGEHADPEPDAPVETVLVQLLPEPPAERTVVKWFDGWKPADERPANPHGLRVLVGGECDEVTGGRIVGRPQKPREHDDRALVRDADGAYWLRYHSQDPPYSVVMLELPESALDEFTLDPQPPPAETGEEEAVHAISLPAEERYRYFVETVARTGWLWTLWDGMSPLEWQGDDDGGRYALVWPHPRAAESYAAGEATEMRPDDQELGSWLATLERDYEFVVVFPTSFVDEGVVVPAAQLAAELRAVRA